jgi:hypothetical protein
MIAAMRESRCSEFFVSRNERFSLSSVGSCMAASLPWHDLEQLIRNDPGGRGVASYSTAGVPLGEGELKQAAVQFAQHARCVAIVTGFAVHDGQKWTAETDGPPGALYLARACFELGIETVLVSDGCGLPLLRAGCRAWHLPESALIVAPWEDLSDDPGHTPAIDRWAGQFLASSIGQRLTHLVAIERVGPSHTLDTLLAQQRDPSASRALFEEHSPPESRNRCHNMRGVSIDQETARLHRLFELSELLRPRPTTIGMADGGNEIGMGKFAWQTLQQAIRKGPAGQVVCRIATDYTILAGVSNWAAYAFAAGVCTLRGRPDLPASWPVSSQRQLIEAMVREASAVDGVTKRREATVDGLPLEDYLSVLAEVQRIVSQ